MSVASAPRDGSRLPREVIAWLQSLDLSTRIHAPRRDLANGFYVGELCRCYWSDVPAHSLENKLSDANKRSNWAVLAKVFARHDAPLSPAMVDGLIAARDPEFAELFLLQLYSLLTGKALRPAATAAALALPPVAAPAAAPYRPSQAVVSRTGAGARGVPSVLRGTAADADERERELRGRAPAVLRSAAPPLCLAEDAKTPAADEGSWAAHSPPLARPTREATGPAAPGSPGGSNGPSTAADARAGVRLTVTVRKAAQASTILHGGAEGNSSGGGDTDSGLAPAAADAPHGGNDDAAATADGAGANFSGEPSAAVDTELGHWLAAVVAKASGGDAADGASTEGATTDFLRGHSAAPRGAVVSAWRTLRAQAPSLAARARQDSHVVGELVELLLLLPMQRAADSGRGGGAEPAVPLESSPSHACPVDPRCWELLAEVLAALAAMDVYAAEMALIQCVLQCTPLVELLLAHRGSRELVEAVATVLLAVTCSLTPAAAAAVLQELLDALHSELLETSAHHPVHAHALYLRVLRSLLARASPLPERASGRGEAGPVLDVLRRLCQRHALMALGAAAETTGETALTATHLVVQLQQTSNGLGVGAAACVDTFLPLVAALGADAAATERFTEAEFSSLMVAKARWLRAAAAALRTAARSPDDSSDTCAARWTGWTAAVLALCEWLGETSRETAAAAAMVACELAALLGDDAVDGALSAARGAALEGDESAPDGLMPSDVRAPAPLAVSPVGRAIAGAVVRLLLSLDGLSPAVGAALERAAAAPATPSPSPSTAAVVTVGCDAATGERWALRAAFAGESNPLLLSEALCQELPPAPSAKEFPPTTAAAAAAVSRRTLTAATALVRDGSVLPTDTTRRLRWLYLLHRLPGGTCALVSCSSPADLCRARWRAVALAFYEDLALAMAAAEVLLSRAQRRAAQPRQPPAVGSADGATPEQTALLSAAATAQRVAVVWSCGLAQPPVDVPAEGCETAEQLASAAEWLHAVVTPPLKGA